MTKYQMVLPMRAALAIASSVFIVSCSPASNGISKEKEVSEDSPSMHGSITDNSEETLSMIGRYSEVSDHKNYYGKSWIVVSSSTESKDIFQRLEVGVQNNNLALQYILVSAYIDAANDKNLTAEERRRFLQQALWTWQRVPPTIQGWTDSSSDIPNVRKSQETSSQGQLQQIAISMKQLEDQLPKKK